MNKIPRFEKNKLTRLIKTWGSSFTFRRDVLDKFKEPTGEQLTLVVDGFFHETVSHIFLATGDAATVQDKPTPYLLTLYNEVSAQIKQGDHVSVNNKNYKVTGKTNIGEWDIAFDISLELVINDQV